MGGILAPDLQAALARAERALADLRVAVELQAVADAGERPIGLQVAAERFGIPERTLRRYASAGCGQKIGKTWMIYASRLLITSRATDV